MKKGVKSSLRFQYFYFDPNLFYDPHLHKSSNQKHLLETQLSLNRSDYYRKEFEKGNEGAIFEYAKESKVCFQSPWVTDQIEKWRVENTPEDRKKLKRVFKYFLGESRGTTSLDELKEIIQKDQIVFREVVRLKEKFPKVPLSRSRNSKGIFNMVKELIGKYGIDYSYETIEDIYKNYKEVSDLFTGRVKIYAIKIGSHKKKTIEKRSGGGRFKDEMEFIEYFMGTPLDNIFQRSRSLSLSLDYRCSRCQNKVVLKGERKLLG